MQWVKVIYYPAIHFVIFLSMLVLYSVHRYSLSRSNKAIAALVCALYPKFPNSSTDNR